MKKKLRKVFAYFLVCICLATCFATVASANTSTDVKLYVNGTQVKNIEIKDVDGDIYVSSNDDLAKIFTSTELGNEFRLPTANGILLKPIAKDLGYQYQYSGKKVYLTNKISDDDMPLTPDEGAVSQANAVTVFVNGLKITGIKAYLSNGEACINNASYLYKIFPKETVDTYFTTVLEETTLKSWAERYGYTCIQNKNRVYLNNDAKTPIEVTLDGTLVEFKDQQAISIPPGRTMVPIRTISEILECDVTWDPDHNRVVIKGDNIRMLLWLNDQTYWLNGKYYESDVAPIIHNNRTLVPLRLISEAFGLKVEYESGTVGTAALSSK